MSMPSSRLHLLEMRAIDALNMKGLLGTNSYYFTIEVKVKLAGQIHPSEVCARYIPPVRIKYVLEREVKYSFF